MQFYQELETLLTIGDPKEKIARFRAFYEAYKKEDVDFEISSEPKLFKEPSYTLVCSIVSPRDVPKRSNLATKEGQVNLVHAVAHIEYSAIDLALDICYRFRNMPKSFYDDWLEVADDEVHHFLMLESILHELGSFYGAVVVHNALFEASQKTAHSLLHRLAVVPRYLEANGLDATPSILQKLQRVPENSVILDNIKSSLELILQEEIDHVKKGDYWFAYVCNKEGISKECYIDIINQYYPNGFAKLKSINKDARLQAGFSCDELKTMTGRTICTNEV